MATEISIGDALALGSGACVALVGAGGKTTTMLSLAEWASNRGLHVLVTTTTKIWRPRGMVTYLDGTDAGLLRLVQHGLRLANVVAAGSRLGAEGKVHGLHPEMVCRLRSESGADLLLCEADGAAGRSLKAHRPGEPVVPCCATHVLVVGALDALSRPVTSVVHRPEEFRAITGLEPLAPVGADAFARALAAAARFAPRHARILFVLNKTDTQVDVEGAAEVAARLLAAEPRGRCLATRCGAVVREFPSG